MEPYEPKPGTLGALLDYNPNDEIARRNVERILDRRAFKKLDYALRHDDDIFDLPTSEETRDDLESLGVCLHPVIGDQSELYPTEENPEELVQRNYDGLTPEDPEYWDQSE